LGCFAHEQVLREQLQKLKQQYQQQQSIRRGGIDSASASASNTAATTLQPSSSSTPAMATTAAAVATSGTPKPARSSSGESSVNGDEQFLHFAQMQAMRDEELNQLRLRINDCTKLMKETEETNRLLQMQQVVLKDEIREMERAQKREGANLLYLKNIVVKYMITKDNEALLPVLSTILQFSPDDLQAIRDANSGSLWGFFASPTKRK
jgi:hypothetical protein